MYNVGIEERSGVMKKMVIVVNGGLYVGDDGKNVFDEVSVREVLLKWNGGKNGFMVDDEEIDVDELIKSGEFGSVMVYEEKMCERGDDYVEIGVVELVE